MDKDNGLSKNNLKKNEDSSDEGEEIESQFIDDYEYEKNSSCSSSYFIDSYFTPLKYVYHLKNEYAKTIVVYDKLFNIKELNWKNPDIKEYQIHFKAYKNIPKCILYPFRKNGAIRTKSFFKANIIWKLIKYDKMSKLIPKLNYYQRFNHFPCTWELGRKDNMSINFQRMNQIFPKDFKYMPETFVLPKDIDLYTEKCNEEPNKKWILKPVASSRGRGIKLITAEDKFPTKCLISNYIDNPHIINNRKYDLRIYIVITNFSPLQIYMYNEGLTRFASEEYKPDEGKNKLMHLTNFSLNKKSSTVDNTISNDDELLGIKWSLSVLKSYFKEKNLNYESLEKKIKDVVVKSVITISDATIKEVKKLTCLPNCLYELYGFDILVDENLEPWLMEVNLNPSLDCEAQMDNKIKSNLLSDLLNRLGVTPKNKGKQKQEVTKTLR